MLTLLLESKDEAPGQAAARCKPGCGLHPQWPREGMGTHGVLVGQVDGRVGEVVKHGDVAVHRQLLVEDFLLPTQVIVAVEHHVPLTVLDNQPSVRGQQHEGQEIPLDDLRHHEEPQQSVLVGGDSRS